MATKEPPLIVFDFDQTLLDKNTDTDVQRLAPNGLPEEVKEVARKKSWTAFVNAELKYLHEKCDVTPEKLLQFIRDMPYVEGALKNIKQLKSKLNAEIIIISDANTVYIEESLKNAGVRDLISKIYTNPGAFNDDGLLEVKPFGDQTDCQLSSRNMCKGQIMQDYIGSRQFSFVAYIGDGSNDFSAMLKLKEGDLALVRKGFALERYIGKKKEEGLTIKADVKLWENGHEVHEAICERFNS